MHLCIGIFLMLLSVSSWVHSEEQQKDSKPRAASIFKTLIMPGKVVESHAHLEQQCDSCHGDFDDSLQAQLCRDCHEEIDADIKLKSGYHGLLKSEQLLECRQCHSDHLGREADIVQLNPRTFDHANTDFALDGGHQELACESCHSSDKKFSEAPQACGDCHEQSKGHGGEKGDQCTTCHSTERWSELSFDHDETEFPLHNSHAQTGCNQCHIDDRYQQTAQSCNACHALEDLHRGQRGTDCADCHNDKKWAEIIYDHSKTDFALEGAHAEATCSQCHDETSYQDSKNFQLPDMACSACHKDQDIHLGSNGTQCADCHSVKRWDDVEFDHFKESEFALVGSHKTLRCDSCHISADVEIDSECGSCHAPDDVHYGGLGQACEQCHTSQNWHSDIRFNHDLTDFPLLGMHALSSCDSCHAGGSYQQLESTCHSCHRDDSPHDEQLGEQCQQCHNPNDWRLWLFDHDSQTDYPLEGKHKNLQCQDCHNRDLAIAPAHTAGKADCYQCHRQDDTHRRRFGTDCGRCHVPDSFREIRIEQPL